MFEIHKRNGQYWWRLKGSNGEILCHSEMYTTKQSAQNGISAAKRAAPDAGVSDKTGERASALYG